jgi:hypothetical protein
MERGPLLVMKVGDILNCRLLMSLRELRTEMHRGGDIVKSKPGRSKRGQHQKQPQKINRTYATTVPPSLE